MSSSLCRRGSSSASCAGPPSRQLPQHAGNTRANQGLVTEDREGEAAQDRREGVNHRSYVTLHMTEVVIPKTLFADILRMIAELRPTPVTSTE